MKMLAVSALAIGLGLAAVSASQAMPMAPLAPAQAASDNVIQVAGGCGPGWHRGPYGGCQPNRGVVVVERPAPVVVVRPVGRVCPYGFVWAYGRCRPV